MEGLSAPVEPNCLHGVFRSVEQWELATGRQAIKLHVGEPAFRPPDEVVEAVVASVRDGRTGYTSAEGLADLRIALTAKLSVHNGLHTTPDLVFVCPGSCQGIAAVLQSIARPGGELLLPELHWPIHLQQCRLAGLRPRLYPLDDGYHPDVAGVAAASSAQTCALLVNSPANPTGAVIGRAALERLLELARSQGWWVISDEAYEDFCYDGEHLSMAALEQGERPDAHRVYTTFSFSKSFAMTGYRLGYVVAPNLAAAARLRAVQEASIIAPATPAQYAGLAALSVPEAAGRNRAHVAGARDALAILVREGMLGGFPRGGWYALADLGPGVDAEAFCAALLLDCGVAAAPARGFSLGDRARSLVRLAICGDRRSLEAGLGQFVAFAQRMAHAHQLGMAAPP